MHTHSVFHMGVGREGLKEVEKQLYKVVHAHTIVRCIHTSVSYGRGEGGRGWEYRISMLIKEQRGLFKMSELPSCTPIAGGGRANFLVGKVILHAAMWFEIFIS